MCFKNVRAVIITSPVLSEHRDNDVSRVFFYIYFFIYNDKQIAIYFGLFPYTKKGWGCHTI